MKNSLSIFPPMSLMKCLKSSIVILCMSGELSQGSGKVRTSGVLPVEHILEPYFPLAKVGERNYGFGCAPQHFTNEMFWSG